MTSMILKLARLQGDWQKRTDACDGLGDDTLERGHSEQHSQKAFHVRDGFGVALSLFPAESLDDAIVQFLELAEMIDRFIVDGGQEELDSGDRKAALRLTYSIAKVLTPMLQTIHLEDTAHALQFYASRDPWLTPEASLAAYRAQGDEIEAAPAGSGTS